MAITQSTAQAPSSEPACNITLFCMHVRAHNHVLLQGLPNAVADDHRSPNFNAPRPYSLSQKNLQKARRENGTFCRGHLPGSLRGCQQARKDGTPPSEHQPRSRKINRRTRKRQRLACIKRMSTSRKGEEACTSKVWLDLLGCRQVHAVCCLACHSLLTQTYRLRLQPSSSDTAVLAESVH